MTGIAMVAGVVGVFLLVVYLAGRAQAGRRGKRNDGGGSDGGFLSWGADGGGDSCGGDGGGCD